jgi:concanavalin A-like lectin/glucanase superfamily protein/type IX secretion system substrate protein
MKKIFTILAITFSLNVVAQIPTNGLVRHYSFSGNANDNVNSQHGTIIGATLTADKNGNPNSAFYFDGVNDYIDLPLSGLLLNEYTYSVWVMLSSIPSAGTATHILSIGSSRAGNTNGGDQAMKVLNASIFGWGLTGYTDPNSALATYDATGLTINTWNHIVATRSSNVQKLYINCNLVAIDSLSSPIVPFYGNVPTAKIGTRQTNVEFFHGNIDDVRIYNRALDVNEILALCNEGVVSIEEQKESPSMQIYPNPTNSIVTVNIENKESVNGYKIEINNLLGQTVYTNSINSTNNSIDLSGLGNKGVYFVKVLDENNNVVDVQKVVYY